MWPYPQVPSDFVTFTKKSLMENLIFVQYQSVKPIFNHLNTGQYY